MGNDPIIDEIRQIRREIETQCGNDPDAYFKYLQDIQKKYKNLVRRSPKPRLILKSKQDGMAASHF